MYPPKKEQEQQARELFLTSEKSRSEIAAEVGVSEKTISNWSVKGHWHELKKASVQAPAVLIQQMYDEITQINNIVLSRPEGQRHPTAAEAELRRKIITSIRAVKRQLSTPELYQAIKSFVQYVTRRNPRHRGLDFYIEEFISGDRDAGKHSIRPSEMEYKAYEEEKKPGAYKEEPEDDLMDEETDNPEFDLKAFIGETVQQENQRYIEEYKKANDGMLPFTEGCDELAVFRHNTKIILEKAKRQ
ncbi:MAG: hypothetical protein JSS82_07920 [Bacteroidetes bacterium]|nr:hypothetical protein [Bacteroidota bacterium]